MLLVDTDVMVEILRQRPMAITWIESLGDEVIALPGLVVLELLRGSPNKVEAGRLRKTLAPFPVYWPTATDCNELLEYFGDARLSHNLGIIDALIGQCAVGLDVKLCTFNAKHYRSIPRIRIEKPFDR